MKTAMSVGIALILSLATATPMQITAAGALMRRAPKVDESLPEETVKVDIAPIGKKTSPGTGAVHGQRLMRDINVIKGHSSSDVSEDSEAGGATATAMQIDYRSAEEEEEKHEVATAKERQPRPKALFCYAKVRTPPEATAPLLANQLSAACDGWALLGDTADPAQNVTKAFERKDSPDGAPPNPGHDLDDAMTQSVMKHLVEAGVLEEYEWIVKFEPDSFVRPSTLRKTFKELHASDMSTKQNGPSDGYFVAIRAETLETIKSFDWPSECSVVLSGDCQSNEQCKDSDAVRCRAKTGISNMDTLRDTKGHTALALDDEQGCFNMAAVLLERASQNITGPLCKCPIHIHHLDRGFRALPVCVSDNWVTIHAVKNAGRYAELVKAFP